jgi:bifunctional non-homologous end joining protein LigD
MKVHKKVVSPIMRRFVIHNHYASHHHFDFRLEYYGTLRSWALPKFMPLYIGDKRLAVQVPNHPLDYINFTGIIPKGQYGAGKVLIADEGTYQLITWSDKKIEFILHGRKYKGMYALIPLADKPNWLLVKGANR